MARIDSAPWAYSFALSDLAAHYPSAKDLRCWPLANYCDGDEALQRLQP